MRLLRVDIESHWSIEGQWLPASGLVVLFGPNSAGKTTVLEAVAEVITEAGALRSDPGQVYSEDVMGSVTFALPEAGTAGTDDARTFASLLSGEQARPSLFGESTYPWPWLDEAQRPVLAKAKASRARAILTAALAKAGSAGTARDRNLLARAVFNPGIVFFTAGYISTGMAVYRPAMPEAAIRAAQRIAAAGTDGDDPLRKIAVALESGDVAYVGQVGGGAGYMNKFTSAFPSVILLDGDHESLSAELFRAVRIVHNRLWHVEEEKVSSRPFPVYTVDGFDIEDSQDRDRYFADPWLESRADNGELTTADMFEPYWEGDWYRVRHSVLAAARLIEAEANRIAPSFVRNLGTIGIQVLPVAVWGASSHRVRATFAEHGDDEPRDLRVVGAGTARWAAAAVRLASRRLEAGKQIVLDEAGTPVTADARREAIRHHRNEALTQTAVRLEPTDAAGFYIADEPEAHLHPAAVRSVRDWLTQLADSAATVLVATHSPALLDVSTSLASRVLVQRVGAATHLRRMTGDLGHELAAVSEELGITQGELLLLTRLAVFVEGPHDQIILHEWFGEELRSAGIRVQPVHGVDNLVGLAESEICAALGIRIATLSDNTSVQRATSGQARTRGESAVARLIGEAARVGLQVRPVGLEQPDILYYLDTTICQQAAPAFPGWPEAAAERAREGARDPWKRWIQTRYGLSLSRDSIRHLARQCRQENKIPAELQAAIHELLDYAAQPSDNQPDS